MLTNVTFRDYKIAVREQNERGEVFDLVRKKWVPLTPEEWVRQHVLHYLIFDKEYPRSLIAVERGLNSTG
jgi:hypothetical protein